MRISDWSSDVCSSDLLQGDGLGVEGAHVQHLLEQRHERLGVLHRWRQFARQFAVGAEVLEVFDFEFRGDGHRNPGRSDEHTSELQSLMRISYGVFCLKKKKRAIHTRIINQR